MKMFMLWNKSKKVILEAARHRSIHTVHISFTRGIGRIANDSCKRSALHFCNVGMIGRADEQTKCNYGRIDLHFASRKREQFFGETRAYTTTRNINRRKRRTTSRYAAKKPKSGYQSLSQKQRKRVAEEFFEVVREGNLDRVRQYIDMGFPPERKQFDRWTALHFASFYGHLDIVKYLIETCQVDKEGKDHSGTTALHIACKLGRIDVATYLIETCQVDVEAKDNDGCTVLHIATIAGRLDMIKYLIESCHSDIKTVDNNGSTVLHIATSAGRLDMIKYLIESGRIEEERNLDHRGDAPFLRASRMLQLEIVDYFMETCNIDKEAKDNFGKTALHCAVSSNNLQMVKHLIQTCLVDKDAKDNLDRTASDVAISFEYRDIIKYLKGAGVKKNVKQKPKYGIN